MSHKQVENVTESIVDLNFTYLQEPMPITEHKWPIGTKPLVTTRTFTYNHEPYIRDCIEGILMQKTTFPVQVLIHDDASTDRTPEIIKQYVAKYPQLITLYEQPENCYNKPNKYELRKPFYDLEKGKYIALCEGDDYWTSDVKLIKQVQFLNNHKECCIVGHRVKYLYEDYNKFDLSNECNTKITDIQTFIKEEYPDLPTLSLMVRGLCIHPQPKYFEELAYSDIALKVLAGKFGGVGFINEVMGTYRRHSTSMTNKDVVEFSRNSISVFEIIENNNPDIGIDFSNRIAKSHARILAVLIVNRNLTNIFNYLYKLDKMYLLNRKFYFYLIIYIKKFYSRAV